VVKPQNPSLRKKTMTGKSGNSENGPVQRKDLILESAPNGQP